MLRHITSVADTAGLAQRGWRRGFTPRLTAAKKRNKSGFDLFVFLRNGNPTTPHVLDETPF